ncbi:hypothetical protein [Actinomadura sp. 6K520]|uniref:hypothetical protein n=1 Tax=Actinomadura sp. 6K520 TaxID=2530364 RepID=UPI0010522A06|nr:hypothetical protein [Actinomadura sp. 6K520]TDE19460.1 hypothetical protein E1289_33315 [Actinomadura sp. 6K520]
MSAMILAAPAMLIVPKARPNSGRACGCVVDVSCAPRESSGTGPLPLNAPYSAGRAAATRHSGENANTGRDSAVSIPVDDAGLALKLSLYRGLGGGATGSFTRDALALTFEGGAGVGGSFSVGSALGIPHSGASFEARASMSGRLRFLNPPDFGLTLSGDGRLQAYMDVKTAHFRTRFRSRSVSLPDVAVAGQDEPPMTRRSWSLGTEFKVAGAYTVKIPWGRFFDVWEWISGLAPGDGDSRPPPPPSSVDHPGYAALLGRTVFKHPRASRPRGSGRRVRVTVRAVAPRRMCVLRESRASRTTRSRAVLAPGGTRSAPARDWRNGVRRRRMGRLGVQAAWFQGGGRPVAMGVTVLPLVSGS